jgi:hypothetical protein
VFGGDAVDKGNGDIRFLRAMLRLKKRYPNRVHLIVGNRDCNKLRFGTELTKEALRDALDDRSFPYWLSEKERVTPAKAYEQEGGLDNTPANRLRFSLPLFPPNLFSPWQCFLFATRPLHRLPTKP